MPKLPALATAELQPHYLISPDQQQLLRFHKAGHHQAAVAVFTLEGNRWRMQQAGFCWLGLARQRWQDRRLQGWQRV
jgi:hypothetical protein